MRRVDWIIGVLVVIVGILDAFDRVAPVVCAGVIGIGVADEQSAVARMVFVVDLGCIFINHHDITVIGNGIEINISPVNLGF